MSLSVQKSSDETMNCLWCGKIFEPASNKQRSCDKCLSNCYRECSRCHYPFPNSSSFPSLDSKVCNKCFNIYEKQKERRRALKKSACVPRTKHQSDITKWLLLKEEARKMEESTMTTTVGDSPNNDEKPVTDKRSMVNDILEMKGTLESKNPRKGGRKPKSVGPPKPRNAQKRTIWETLAPAEATTEDDDDDDEGGHEIEEDENSPLPRYHRVPCRAKSKRPKMSLSPRPPQPDKKLIRKEKMRQTLQDFLLPILDLCLSDEESFTKQETISLIRRGVRLCKPESRGLENYNTVVETLFEKVLPLLVECC